MSDSCPASRDHTFLPCSCNNIHACDLHLPSHQNHRPANSIKWMHLSIIQSSSSSHFPVLWNSCSGLSSFLTGRIKISLLVNTVAVRLNGSLYWMEYSGTSWYRHLSAYQRFICSTTQYIASSLASLRGIAWYHFHYFVIYCLANTFHLHHKLSCFNLCIEAI